MLENCENVVSFHRIAPQALIERKVVYKFNESKLRLPVVSLLKYCPYMKYFSVIYNPIDDIVMAITMAPAKRPTHGVCVIKHKNKLITACRRTYFPPVICDTP